MNVQWRAISDAQASLSPLQRVNWILLLACFTMLLVGISHALLHRRSDHHVVLNSVPLNNKEAPRLVQLTDLTHRNLFEPLIPPPAPVPVHIAVALPPPPPKIPLSQKASALHLVGILRGEPLQAIIEDQQNQKTLYVSAGGSINDIHVEKVLGDRVLLSSDGEQMELPL